MAQAQFISSDNNTFPEWLNFEYLRQRGLEHIGQLSGGIWTDHNTHDPGITMLEVLCYALMDLGYRNQFDTAAIFAQNPSDLVAPGYKDDNFWTPAEMLSGNPLTLDDYARLLLDIPGIRNAWVEDAKHQEVDLYRDKNAKALEYGALPLINETTNPLDLSLSGLYNVYLDLEPFLSSTDSYGKNLSPDSVIAAARERLHAHRNLCEDFLNISIIPEENVWFCLELDLNPEADPEAVFLNIFDAVQQMLTPSPQFKTLQQMLDKGYSIDQIFEGRPLIRLENGQAFSHGFLEPDMLKTLKTKDELNLSDVYQIIISQLPDRGVRGIRRLTFFSDSAPTGTAWHLKLNRLKSPRLLLEKCEILYNKGQLPILYDTSNARRKLTQRLANYNKVQRSPYELGDLIPHGKHYDFADYTSIQREFPAVYGINENQLPLINKALQGKEQQAKMRKKHQVLQLKAYLAFFDQVLANYLVQLGNVRQLFALRPKELPRKTYYNTLVHDMPDAELLVRMSDLEQQNTENYTLFRGRPLARMLPPIDKRDQIRYEDYSGFFKSKASLKNASNLFQQAFEQGIIQAEIHDRWDEKDGEDLPEDKRFYFLYRLSGQGAVLISELFYPTKNAAEDAAHLLRYLAYLKECYQDREIPEGYIGLMVYNPIAYADYLSQITESVDTFHERREHFLDHLLARFAEQFTEYTLLAFAMDGAKKALPEVVVDKARFLSRYDETSRNHGKGFNYTNPKVWDTENVSGFEQRVAGFMGLDNWRRRTLNHLKLTADQPKQHVQWSIGGTPLFESHSPQVSEGALETAFTAGIIQRHDCLDEGLYSFSLKSEDGCTQIRYLPCFIHAKEREAAIEYWQKRFVGQIVSALENDQRFRFVLNNAADELVLKSKNWYDKKTSTEQAFYEAVQFALDENNYENINNGRSLGQEYNFSFFLKDASGTRIAEAVTYYQNSDQRNTARADFILALQSCWPKFAVDHTESFFEWTVRDQAGKLLFQSSRRYKTYDEAGAFETIWQALLWARQDNGWRLMVASGNSGYYWSLGKIDAKARLFLPADKSENWLEIGRVPGHYATEWEAQMALKQIRETLSVPTYLEQAIQPEGKSGYRFIWTSSQSNEALFISKQFFNTRTEAAIAFEAFLQQARNIDRYILMADGRVRIPVEYVRVIPSTDPKVEGPVFDTETIEAISMMAFPEANWKVYCEKIRDEIEAGIAQMSSLLHTAGRYFTRISIMGEAEKELRLIGKGDHQHAAEAYKSLETQLQALAQGGLKVLESPFPNNYRLLLLQEEDILAEADEEFEKAPTRILPSSLKAHPDVISDSYGYRIAFIDCASNLEYFYSTSDQVFETAEAAITAGEQVLQIFNEAEDKNALLKIEGTKVLMLDAPKGSWLAETQAFPNAELAAGIQKSIIKNLPAAVIYEQVKTAQPCAPEVPPGKVDDFCKPTETKQLLAPDLEASSLMALLPSFQEDYPQAKSTKGEVAPIFNRFRLRDENQVFARFHKTFADAESRNAAFIAFWEYWQCAEKSFPELLLPKILRETKPRTLANKVKCPPQFSVQPYYFQLSFACGEQCFSLRSHEVFRDEQEAKAALSDHLLVSYMELLADGHAYVVQTLGGSKKRYEIQVYDYRKVSLKPKFRVVETYKTQLEANIALKKLSECAARYPFFIDQPGKIGLRLFNTSSLVYEWIGTANYDTLMEARYAFAEMLRLLEVPVNIRRITKPFGLDLGEVMLDSKTYVPEPSENTGCLESVRNEVKVWEIGVDTELMNRVFHPKGVIVAPVENGCAYTFKVVNDGYHLAFHPCRYRNAQLRAEKKKELIRLYACGAGPQTSSLLANISLDVKLGKDKLGEEITQPGHYSFKFDKHDFEWRAPLNQDNKSANDFWYEQLNPWVEYPEFYNIRAINEAKDQHQLELLNEDGSRVAIAYLEDAHLLTLEQAQEIKKNSILLAREFPLKWMRPTRKAQKGDFVLKIYSRFWQTQEPQTDQIPGAYIWQSFSHFETSDQASKYEQHCFQTFHKAGIINSSNGLLDTQGDNCTDYSFELVDNERLIAQYPGRFYTRSAVEEGIKRMQTLLDAEGFHVVENILLRPSMLEKDAAKIPLLQLSEDITALWDAENRKESPQSEDLYKACFDQYLPGGDPYSAQVTVMIPYWARRFRNPRFQDFFENTLRRELPVHCMLRVYWITPRDMYRFELHYKQWLKELASGNMGEGSLSLIHALNEVEGTHFALVLDDPKAFIDDIILS